MLRLVERRFGEGHLQDANPSAPPIHVGFELEVYRDWQVQGTDLTPGEWVIEGRLLASPESLDALAGRSDPFVLHMDDGRDLQVFVLDGAGRVVNVEGTTFSDAAPR
jgi:hypothetical protein